MAESLREQLKDLALGCRILAREGQGDMIWGHVSVRDPSGEGIWMKGHTLGLEEITPADILHVGFDGKVLEGRGRRHNEWPIHTELMLPRPSVNCVVHTHPPYAITFGALSVPLRPVSHEALRFSTPEFPRFTQTSNLITTPTLGKALAGTLAANDAVLLQNHGIAVTGPDIQSAVIRAVFLERACQLQLMALSTGQQYAWTRDDELEEKRAIINSRESFKLAFEYYRRVMSH